MSEFTLAEPLPKVLTSQQISQYDPPGYAVFALFSRPVPLKSFNNTVNVSRVVYCVLIKILNHVACPYGMGVNLNTRGT